ncbi:hypothetical protein F4818DRAFT_440945 [Hypoxylon cercidicola]|nr:hypothetical protein F4818DRAFT_440945 [Hypoxylon cercidicola]
MSSSAEETTQEVFQIPRLTFGVELEFLVAWLYYGEPDRLDKVEGMPLVFRVAQGSDEEVAMESIQNEISRLFEAHDLPVEVTTTGYETPFAEEVLSKYSKIGVTTDPSVHEAPIFGNFKFAGMEIQTFVAPDDPEAFEIVDYIRSLLIRYFRVRVNPTCGLHVHVGQGAERFSPDRLRRISSLVWAAEPLLVMLNHPFRIANDTCEPQRERGNISRLGSGIPVFPPTHCRTENEEHNACVRYVAAEVRHGEALTSWREQNVSWREKRPYYVADYTKAFEDARRDGGDEPFQIRGEGPSNSKEDTYKVEDYGMNIDEVIEFRIDEYLKNTSTSTGAAPKERPESPEPAGPSRTRNIPRIKNSRPTAEQLNWFADHLGNYFQNILNINEGGRFTDPGVFEGQLRGPSHFDMVSFRAYTCMEYKSGLLRTIEFRGAEGNLSWWVKWWAKICVGLVRFAINAPVDEFIRVLMNCERSMKEEYVYDIIDLIDDLGLPAEAAAAEFRIKEIAGEWEFEFADNKEGDSFAEQEQEAADVADPDGIYSATPKIQPIKPT